MNNLIPDEFPNPGDDEVQKGNNPDDDVFVFPASFGQQRLWFLDQFEPGSPYYNIPLAVRLRGTLNITVLDRVINEIIRRHESLRTTFATVENKPVQIIRSTMVLPLIFSDFSNFTKNQQDAETRRILVNEARHSFNLQAGPLIRFHVVKLSEKEHLALCNMHHIISDGWSMGIFFQELVVLYDAFSKGYPSPLPELTLQYADYADWQREWLQGDVLDAQLAYWQNQLTGIPPVLDLPVDRPRPSVQTNAGANAAVDVSRQQLDRLIAFSRNEGATLFMTLLAAFQILLARLSGQDDISIGTPVANRTRTEVEQIIGLFINTLLIRTQVDLQISFRGILKKVKENSLGAFSHQDIPFEMLVDALQPERDMSHSPLFQVMFILQNAQQKEAVSTTSDLSLEQIDVDSGTSTFDITISATEQPENLNLSIEYNTDLFDRSTINRFLDHFVVLLDAILTEPDVPAAILPVMTQQEKTRILVDWNDTHVAFPERHITVPQLFEAQVNRTPEQIAVVLPENGSNLRQSITYSDLNREANILAHALRTMDVGPESIVGVCLEKSIETVIAILGILKAGGAYLPLDPQYPSERLSFMITDSKIQIMITNTAILPKLPGSNTRSILLDPGWKESLSPQAINNVENFPSVNSPNDLIYLIYTSGSTGQAKGVMLEHRNLVNAFLGWQKDYTLSDVHSHLQMASFSFDVFSGDFVRALCSGGKLVLCPRDFLLMPEELFRVVNEEQIDIAEFVPAVLRTLVQYLERTGQKLSAMRLLICGSDSWYAEEYKTFLEFCGEHTRLINSFGLTEATIDSTYYEGTVRNLSSDQVVPIGKPFPNTFLYILDKNLQPVPIGVKGELFIGGSGVARGYLNRPELTQEKFISNPLQPINPQSASPSRLYRTGDATRYLPDGNIEFLGRIDFQVKIRGFRVETGEVEAVLRQFPGIQDAVVIAARAPAASGEASNFQRLVGYVSRERIDRISSELTANFQINDQDYGFTITDIRLFLKSRLPDYMVPSIFVVMDSLPLTPNGKIDRQALPIPDWTKRDVEANFVAPRNPIEENLVEIWSQLLGLERVGVFDNFFELGGHSLLATQVISRIRTHFKIDMPLRNIFESPTISALSEHIEKNKLDQQRIEAPPIVPVTRDGTLIPLSFAQQRLWFLDQLEPNSSFYNLPESVKLRGRVNIELLERSLNEIVRRHESLRTIFKVVDGQPVQWILPELTIQIPIINLECLQPSKREAEALRLAGEEIQKPFNLEVGPLLRVAILRLTEFEHIALFTMHHIIGDAWSSQVLVQELTAIYSAFTIEKPSPLEELPLQYADYAHWQRNWLKDEILEEQVNYWKQQLAGLPPVLELATDRPRPSVQTFNGAFYSFLIPEKNSEQIRKLSQQKGVTLFMLMLAAFQTLLYRYTSQEQLAIGTPIANRNRGEIENLIGFFVNTLVLNADFSSDPTFVEFLEQVKGRTLGAYAHQDIPFEMVVDALKPERNLSHSPLFQVMFTLQNSGTRVNGSISPQEGGLSISPLEIHSGTSKFDLTLFLLDEADRISGVLEYNTDLFNANTIDRMIGHFRMILEGITLNPDQKIWMLPLLTNAEKEQVIHQWNDTVVQIPDNLFAHNLFEEQVSRNPDSVAVSQLFISGRKILSKREISFLELNQKTNQLANYLVRLGIGPDKLVGICLERSIDLVVSILGVLKAGGAYIPLDPTYPPDRLKYMIEDSRVSVLITQEILLERLDHEEPKAISAPTIICIDRDWFTIEVENNFNIINSLTQENLAYVIYTSGSTGKPKGAMIQHKGLVNYLLWCQKAYPISMGQGSPVHSSISFDLTVTSLFSPLISGHCVTLPPEDLGVEGLEILLGLEEDFSLVKITPAHLQMLGEQIHPENAHNRTRAFIIGGENLLADHVAFWQKNSPTTQLVNEYGPTETVVGCCVYWVPENQATTGIIPIGKPIFNTRLYVLDSHQQPVPIGIPGELFIGGMGVGRGYLNRPELTAERYLPDPFSGETGARMYRSGDLVRYLPDGNLTCLGRIDFQVKIRGFRVELGEIEAVLTAHPDIKDTCVWVHQDATGKRLVAYVVPHEDAKDLQPLVLRAFLRQKLPEYMVPTVYIFLSEMPLTPNGKIDRKALPSPDLSQFMGGDGIIPLRTPEEELIASIWSGVLGIKTIGASDNFFELGGHSLLATQIVARLTGAFGFDIPLKYIFEFPTVEQLAQRLSEERLLSEGLAAPAILPVPREQNLPLSFAQQRLWFLDQLSPGTPYYNIPVAVRLKGELNSSVLESSINALIKRHESLRTTFKHIDLAATDEQQVVQVIAPDASIALTIHDLSELDPGNVQSQADLLLQKDALTPFDLEAGPLIRASLIKMGDDDHILNVNSHHIITDDWSLGIFVQELAIFYSAITSGDDALTLLPGLPVQYADYAFWQRNWFKGQVLEKQYIYWQEQLSDLPPMLELPIDFNRPAIQSFRGDRLVRSFSLGLSKSLRDLSQSQGSTLFMILLSGLEILMNRYSGQEIFGIGTPIANRTRIEQENLIGFFVNTLVMKADFSDSTNLKDLFTNVRRTALDAYAHQDLPFEMLVDRLHPARNLSHTPFFQVMLVLQNAPKKSLDVDTNLQLEPVDFTDGIARFDLTVTVVDDTEQLSIAFDFNADLFKSQTIDRMCAHLEQIFHIITENPDIKLQDIDYLLPSEIQTILIDWNKTEEPIPDTICAHEIFIDIAANNPDVTAVIFAGEDRQVLTYRELDEKSNQLAHYLQGIGVGPEIVVGVSVRRSVELIIGILGILKAGGAYLPLDPNYPGDRLAYMIMDANPMIILTQADLIELLPFGQTPFFCLDKDWGACSSLPCDTPINSITQDNLAYIIYTSGSTGKPKGVMLQHRGLVNLIITQERFYKISKGLNILQFAALSFDASVWEIFLTICHGATLILALQDILSSGLDLLNLLRREKIHMVTFPPSLLSVLGPEDLPDLQTIIAAGEPCTKEIVDRWAPGRRFVDAYGPTETTVCASLTECFAGDPLPPSIGKAIGNFKLYVVDQFQHSVPVGVPGELWIGGESLARGYLNRDDLTKEKFITNPFDNTHGSRVYRTGDRVRWRDDGNLEFLGRIDDQVKIRGFRIELGEIEAVLLRIPEIRQTAVVAQVNPKLGSRLVAFYLATPENTLQASYLQEKLRLDLPEYMIPSVFIPLETFPLSPAGKIDKKALKGIQVQNTDRSDLSVPYEAPANPEEEELVKIFEDLLGLELVGRHENFFELGGHSLLATRVISRIKVEFQVEIPLRVLFERPTVAEIASFIINSRSGLLEQTINEHIPLLPRDKDDAEILRAPLSFAQQRLWFIDQFDPDKANYNLPIVVRISGNIDFTRIQESLDILVQRHEILRTVFRASSLGVGEQIVLSRTHIPFEIVSTRESKESLDVEHLLGAIENEVRQPFSLAEAPAIRVKIFQIKESENYLVINMHHIISDGWSLGILIRELVEIYIRIDDRAQSVNDWLPPLPIQYADFAAWQRSWLTGDQLKDEIHYWVNKLSGLPASINLPADYPRPPVQTFNGHTVSFNVPPEITGRVQKFCKEEGITLFMGLLAAFDLLLWKYSGQAMFSVGTPIANRTRLEVEGLIGFFVNTLVLRADLSEVVTFRELVSQVKTTALEAYSHQEVPFEMLVDRIQPNREMSHSPLFQVVFSMQNNQVMNMESDISGLQISPFDADTGVSKFDLTLSFADNGDFLSGAIEYNTDLFMNDSILRMQDHLLRLIDQVFSFPEQPVGSFGMLTEYESQTIIKAWNQTNFPIDDQVGVHELFSRNARLRPNMPAVAFGGTTMTYADLDAKSTKLALFLNEQGVTTESVVGICLERSTDVIISLLATMKAGGIYLPLDPGYPTSRISYMIEDITNWQSGKKPFLITQASLLDRLPEINDQVLCIEQYWDQTFVQGQSLSQQKVVLTPTSPDQLSYIIYTSGSTGKPKGVALHHLGLQNMVESNIRDFHLMPGDSVLQFASLSFDASLNEIFLALVSGAKLVMTQREILTSPVDLADLLKRENVTFCIFPPSLLKVINPGQLTGIKTLVSAGESCSLEIADQWSRGRRFFNAYGPTETTIGPTLYHVEKLPERAKTVPIGRPIDNMQVYILDPSLQPLPVGVPGEIYIGGVGLARCYINLPELTSERFIQNPFEPSSRIYKTGDLGKWLPDGNIEYLGRVDFQVKIRGFRIELEEIERILNLYPEVNQSVVIAREDVPGSKRLVAYVEMETAGQSSEKAQSLRSYLRDHLPEYMVPAALVILDEFPLTPNRKIDRQALPAPEFVQRASQNDFIPPMTTNEIILVEIWKSLLGLEQVSINDNFFELGGDSILSIQLVARANLENIHITPKQVFEHPTIIGLSSVAGQEAIIAEQGLVVGEIPLTPIQIRFFDHHLVSPDHWNTSMMLAVFQEIDLQILRETIKTLLEHHDALRMKFAISGEGWIQFNQDTLIDLPISVIDLKYIQDEMINTEVEKAADFSQKNLDLQHGPLMQVVLMQLPDGIPARLLFIFHHTVFDGVSWRIFIEDFQAVYTQLMQNQTPQLLPKTTSYKEWSTRLFDAAQTDDVIQELSIWENFRGEFPLIPVDFDGGSNRYGDSRIIVTTLSNNETEVFIKEAPGKFHSQVNEIMISLLVRTLSKWIGSRSLMLELYGHGRESIFNGIDISRTIGWFTTAYPVLLDISQSQTLKQEIDVITEQLRRIPNHGISYGMLRYLTVNPQVQSVMKEIPTPQINFNYLGQFDQSTSASADEVMLPVYPAPESRGLEQNPDNDREALLFVVASVTGGEMNIYWNYSSCLHKAETIQRLADGFLEQIRDFLKLYSDQNP
jgi:amino acid adenylation domain-containing protein/non-ribosomal peptide synthase protein (TIGR01720 family)